MSSKPTKLPRWAVDGSGNLASNIVEPAPGEKDAGFPHGSTVLSSYENWKQSLVYLWLQYLSDGDVQLHDVQTATLETTGNVAIGGTLGVTGATTLGGALAVAGDATITGRVVATGPSASLDLRNTGDSSKRVRLQAPASLSTDQTWTLPPALPSSGRAALHVDSTGAVTADRYSINVGAANAQLTSVGLSGPAQFDGTAWFLGTSGTAQGPVFDVPLPTGETITAWKVLGTKNSASGTITATFTVRNTATGATVITGTATNSANAPGNIALTGSTGSLPFLVPDGHSLTVSVDGGGVTGDSIRGVNVTF